MEKKKKKEKKSSDPMPNLVEDSEDSPRKTKGRQLEKKPRCGVSSSLGFFGVSSGSLRGFDSDSS